jgi:hypothetical protein
VHNKLMGVRARCVVAIGVLILHMARDLAKSQSYEAQKAITA